MKTFVDIEERRQRIIALNKARAVPVEERLWCRAELVGECFVWTGVIGRGGYGGIQISGKRQLVHRVAYELVVGSIPKKLTLDHLCRNRACINPMHLEPVTQKENTRRGISHNSLKTHCKYGHKFDEANTYYKGNARSCRRCKADREYRGIKPRYKYTEELAYEKATA